MKTQNPNNIVRVLSNRSKMEFSNRKGLRLKQYDYSSVGAYFITLCTKNRVNILSNITVGTGVLDCPQICLTKYGKIADKYIRQMNEFYNSISVETYVIMPNHIHLLINIEDGQSGRPVPTSNKDANSSISKFVGTFKRFSNKEYGENIWQSRFYDHIIRDKNDYEEVCKYINTNVLHWKTDNLNNSVT